MKKNEAGDKIQAFLACELLFDTFVFNTPAFPACEFADPAKVRSLVGPYSLQTAFYNGRGRPVRTASQPGRYAAVVRISAPGMRPTHRFFTLYRTGSDLVKPPWLPPAIGKARWEPVTLDKVPLRVALPPIPGAGIARQTYRRYKDQLDAYASSRLAIDLFKKTEAAVVLSALHDLEQRKAADRQTVEQLRIIEREWWVAFKRRFYGLDKVYKKPFVSPAKISGKPARVLRSGSLAQAGLKPGFTRRMDAICRQWAREGGRGFNICVARHGIVAFSRAYGTDNGRPVTTATTMNIASATKMLAVSLILQFVDRGLLRLDDPADKHIPAFRNIKVRRPMTIHQMYDMMCGFEEHWSDELNDFEERAADLYPAIEVGRRIVYQGIGHSLGSKIMEYISAKALPRIFQDHLFGPLGCKASHGEYSAAGAVSNARDLLTVGQMLVNGGRYGKWRFFSEDTLKQIALPVNLERKGPEKDVRWGMGTKLRDTDGLSHDAFGHSGAHGAFLFVDPQHDLVLTQVSTGEGRDYHAWRGKVFSVVLADMI